MEIIKNPSTKFTSIARDKEAWGIIPVCLPQPHKEDQEVTVVNKVQVWRAGEDVLIQRSDTVSGKGTCHFQRRDDEDIQEARPQKYLNRHLKDKSQGSIKVKHTDYCRLEGTDQEE